MFGGKSDPFIRISRRTETTGGTFWQPVLQTQVKRNESSPLWERVQMPLSRVCLGDMRSKLLLEVRSTAGLHALARSPIARQLQMPPSLAQIKLSFAAVQLAHFGHFDMYVRHHLHQRIHATQSLPDPAQQPTSSGDLANKH